MKLNIIFPQNTGQRYWNVHFQYVLNIFQYLGYNIAYKERDDFIVTIEGEDFLFDYWDTSDERKSSLRIFKFHCSKPSKTILPFPPVSFHNWEQYFELEKTINYYPNKPFISSRQKPYADALKRRKEVQALLQEKFGEYVLTKIIDQVEYWKEINNIGVSVCVPGYHNNMVDRGHLQYIAFGCPTVSPNLPEVFPYMSKLIPNTHYTQCNDDYSDLVEILNKFMTIHNVEKSIEIGKSAKKFFVENCTPMAIGNWIEANLK